MIHHRRCDSLACEGDCLLVLSRRSFVIGLGSALALAAAGVSSYVKTGPTGGWPGSPGVTGPTDYATSSVALKASLVGDDLSNMRVVYSLREELIRQDVIRINAPNHFMELLRKSERLCKGGA